MGYFMLARMRLGVKRSFLEAIGSKAKESWNQFLYVWGQRDYLPSYAARSLTDPYPFGEINEASNISDVERYLATEIYREESDFAAQQDAKIYKFAQNYLGAGFALDNVSLNTCVDQIMRNIYEPMLPTSRVVFKNKQSLKDEFETDIETIRNLNPEAVQANICSYEKEVAKLESEYKTTIEPEFIRLQQERTMLSKKLNVEQEVEEFDKLTKQIRKIESLLKPSKKMQNIVIEAIRHKKEAKISLSRRALQSHLKELIEKKKTLEPKLDEFHKQVRSIQDQIALNSKEYSKNRERKNEQEKLLNDEKLKLNLNEYIRVKRREIQNKENDFIKSTKDKIEKSLKEYVTKLALTNWINQNIVDEKSELATQYEVYKKTQDDDLLYQIFSYIKASAPIFKDKEINHVLTYDFVTNYIKDKSAGINRISYYCKLSEFTNRKSLTHAKKIATKTVPQLTTPEISQLRSPTPSALSPDTTALASPRVFDFKSVIQSQAAEISQVGKPSVSRLNIESTLQEVKTPPASPQVSPRSPTKSQVKHSFASEGKYDSAIEALSMPRFSHVVTRNPLRLLTGIFISGPIEVLVNIPVLKYFASPLILVKAAVECLSEAISYGCSKIKKYKQASKLSALRAQREKEARELREQEDKMTAIKKNKSLSSPTSSPRGKPSTHATVKIITEKAEAGSPRSPQGVVTITPQNLVQSPHAGSTLQLPGMVDGSPGAPVIPQTQGHHVRASSKGSIAYTLNLDLIRSDSSVSGQIKLLPQIEEAAEQQTARALRAL